MNIEIVNYEDRHLTQVIDIAREIHEHSVYADIPMDEPKLIQQLKAFNFDAPNGYFRLAVMDGIVYGGFLGVVSPTFFCPEKIAKDQGWWVKPRYRGSSAAIRLLRDFERWAREKGARKVMIGQTGVENIEKTTRLFKHCGYEVCGYNTVKDLS
jgi:GNAT superfamily N-acetyltransferase